ncbi:MAG: mechanosensitive ion channel family protein [Rhodospirillaceae bacterium]|jgi:small conductance mechanosensitive channel|nr:mechanosensitive ion channel family protein [Rhodospirillaceae bacterium]MBT3886922.1 mechanosensitive ion channel family protein [Rhodospirillaceae bacterium]MBT4115153.1 mechanosensitive ion channel family protein [Rhodospirillaceae bacterium]MBT4670495.1 mechanosensitive ion channel family protein [Rhodospirillaceae bacterium]MBT4751058.1 mechanosensitive ion channel family protein [Rhodospirillaceae bacterium]
MEEQIQSVSKVLDVLLEFSVSYGFQILGALLFLFVGLKVAGWSGRRTASLATGKAIDPSLARFIGNIVKLVIVAFVAVITLGNFGVSTAPLIALAGASAFGATLALQGPLSNYGAGFAILMGRQFAAGNSITIGKVSGVVQDITLAATVLTGEDGERITIPNKEIVGQVIVNSKDSRIVETRIAIGYGEDAGAAIEALRATLNGDEAVTDAPPPQIGIHDFTYGGVILGLRYWVPGNHYFQNRYRVNLALLEALKGADITLLEGAGIAVPAPELSADGEQV